MEDTNSEKLNTLQILIMQKKCMNFKFQGLYLVAN